MQIKKDSATLYYHQVCKLEKNFGEAIRRIKKLEEENKTLRKENVELKIENAMLKEKIFGEKKDGKDNDDGDDDFVSLRKKKKSKTIRAAKSYRRQIPREEEITESKEYKIKSCPNCGGNLSKRKTLERFIEDIPNFFQIVQKLVTQELIHSGYCSKCRKRHYAKETNLQGQQVTIGNNTKLLVLYLIYIQNLSFENVKNVLYDLYRLKISKGEISNILEEAAEKLEEEHLNIRNRIRGKPAGHMDETGWRKLAERYFGWIFTSSEGKEISLEIKNSRGKGVAEEILGNNYKGCLTTDFFPVYKNLTKDHQTCWVHLTRDFENLAKNKNVPKELQNHVYKRYAKICQLYDELCKELAKPFQIEKRKKIRINFKLKLKRFAILSKKDCELKKLKNLKLRIQEYLDELTICLVKEGVQPQNNKAERDLRHLVIKRKISFGSRSDKTCKILSINLSVLLSYWKTVRDNFFSEINNLLFVRGVS